MGGKKRCIKNQSLKKKDLMRLLSFRNVLRFICITCFTAWTAMYTEHSKYDCSVCISLGMWFWCILHVLSSDNTQLALILARQQIWKEQPVSSVYAIRTQWI